MSLIFSLLKLTLFRSTWAVFQIMQRSSYLKPAAALVSKRGWVTALCPPPFMPTVQLPWGSQGRSAQGAQQRSITALRADNSLVSRPWDGCPGKCAHTHLLGFLGLMLTGGPGGPSFLGKMSTHICTFPWNGDGLVGWGSLASALSVLAWGPVLGCGSLWRPFPALRGGHSVCEVE